MSLEFALSEIKNGWRVSNGTGWADIPEPQSRRLDELVVEMTDTDISSLIFDLPLYADDDFSDYILVSLYGFLKHINNRNFSSELGFLLRLFDLQNFSGSSFDLRLRQAILLRPGFRNAVIAFLEYLMVSQDVQSDFLADRDRVSQILLQWKSIHP